MREAKTSTADAARMSEPALGEGTGDQEKAAQDLCSPRHGSQTLWRRRYSSEVALTAALLGIPQERAAEALRGMKHRKVEH